ncbi:hypothetical protein CAEBREN_25147 [Caenorhabditis brenneri]|uniref:SPK domain-containing protein n=1 Tax=Caenorhabditis brenneri TaxID=135651 RepID=G0PF22_CAEBE|nr:hypothetical protein CAEBREN_25147 [Caenorhabditis brenneri]
MTSNSPPRRLMRWILEEKGDCTDRVPLLTLFNEYPRRNPVQRSIFLNGVKQNLQRVDRLRDFGLDEKVKLLFMFNFPVNDEFEEIETRGIREVIQDMIREIKLNDSDDEGPKKSRDIGQFPVTEIEFE